MASFKLGLRGCQSSLVVLLEVVSAFRELSKERAVDVCLRHLARLSVALAPNPALEMGAGQGR